MANENFKPLASAIPTPGTGNSSSLVRATTGASAELIGELTALFKCLAIRGGTLADVEANFRLYADALVDLPMVEVSAVLRLFRIGDLGDGHWCPKPAEIRQTIQSRLAKRAEADRRERLEAEQIAARNSERGAQTPEQRARVQAILDQFKAGLPQDDARPKAHRLPTKAEAETTLANPPAHWSGPVPISHELGEKLGLTPEQIDAFAREVCR